MQLLTMFSVLIELSEATKSWQDTFVGTPEKKEKKGREKERENLKKVGIKILVFRKIL